MVRFVANYCMVLPGCFVHSGNLQQNFVTPISLRKLNVGTIMWLKNFNNQLSRFNANHQGQTDKQTTYTSLTHCIMCVIKVANRELYQVVRKWNSWTEQNFWRINMPTTRVFTQSLLSLLTTDTHPWHLDLFHHKIYDPAHQTKSTSKTELKQNPRRQRICKYWRLWSSWLQSAVQASCAAEHREEEERWTSDGPGRIADELAWTHNSHARWTCSIWNFMLWTASVVQWYDMLISTHLRHALKLANPLCGAAVSDIRNDGRLTAYSEWNAF